METRANLNVLILPRLLMRNVALVLSDRNGIGMKHSPRCTFIRRRDAFDEVLKGSALGKEMAIAVQRPLLSREPRSECQSVQDE